MQIKEKIKLENKEWRKWSGKMDDEDRNKRLIWAMNKMKKRNIHTVLDAGCGLGWHTKILDKVYKTIGIDISDVAIEKAIEAYPNSTFKLVSIEKIRDNYDAIVCLSVFQSVMNEKEALDVISKHSKWGYFSFQNYVDHKLHLRSYDLKKVKKLLKGYGDILNIEEIPDFIMVEIKFNDKIK